MKISSISISINQIITDLFIDHKSLKYPKVAISTTVEHKHVIITILCKTKVSKTNIIKNKSLTKRFHLHKHVIITVRSPLVLRQVLN